MKTDELIGRLAADLKPVSKHQAAMALVRGLAGGMAVSFVLMVLWLGVRPDFSQAVSSMAYWMKFGYTAALAIFAFWMVERLARPGVSAERPAWLSLLPFLALAIVAALQLWSAATPAQRLDLMMGSSAQICPWLIVVLSLPVFTGVFWGLRHLAPVRSVLSGAAAGLLSGAAGAWIYAFHCTESAAPFVAGFYTLGIVLAALIGAALGRLLLKW